MINEQAADSAIEIRNLGKIYPQTPKSESKEAVKAVNLTIKKGTFFGLLGPNGAGKSTIINILAGLTKKTSGRIRVMGIDQDENPRACKFKLGVVPQELVLDPFFSIHETLEIYAGYYGIAKNKRKTTEIIEALGLKDKANVPPRSLSGGMKRRFLVAKALVHSPEILILDEPTAGVDVDLRNQLWDYVKKLNRQGTTILLTTHYLQEAEELCDQIAIINHGSVIANDSKQNLMKTLSSKELTVTCIDPIPETLNLPDLEIKMLPYNQMRITYDTNNINVEDILKRLTAEQLHIKDLSTKQPDLEEVFKFLVSAKS